MMYSQLSFCSGFKSVHTQVLASIIKKEKHGKTHFTLGIF